jgi:hypothetical protein
MGERHGVCSLMWFALFVFYHMQVSGLLTACCCSFCCVAVRFLVVFRCGVCRLEGRQGGETRILKMIFTF